MSTREIAELTGKRHDHVLYDTRKMLADLGKDAPEFSGSSQVPGPYGRMVEVPVFNLPKDLTLTLVSGYNVQMRHRIITRWLELEEVNKAPQVPAIASHHTANRTSNQRAKKTASLGCAQVPPKRPRLVST